MVYKLYTLVSLSAILLLGSSELSAGINPDLPMIELPADQVCEGVSYVHPSDMQEHTGTRSCVNLQDHRCQGAADEDCYVTAPHQAVAKSAIDADKIKSGATVAGVTGTLNLASFNPPCTSIKTTECQTSAAFPAVDISKLIPQNIVQGATVLGVAGSYEDPIALCSDSQRAGCQVQSPYVAVDKTKLIPANIKKDIEIGGIEGDFPSSNHPLAEPSEPDLTDVNFATKIAQESLFGFFDSAGTHHTMAGKVLDPATIASGVTILNVTGTAVAFNPPDFRHLRPVPGLYGGKGEMKLDCRNGFADGHDLSASLYPSIDDGSASAATNLKWGTMKNCGPELWENATPDGIGGILPCDVEGRSYHCIYRDKVADLLWLSDPSKPVGKMEEAKAYCENLDASGISDWRLPTHREMLQAYVHGIRYLPAEINFLSATLPYWTSSTRPHTNEAYIIREMAVKPENGETIGISSTNLSSLRIMCVH